MASETEERLKAALKSAVAHAKIQRSHGRTSKSTAKLSGIKAPKKKKGAGKSKRTAKPRTGNLTPAQQKQVAALVTPEAQQHGIYEPVDFKLQEVTEGGKRTEKAMNVVMNRGGTAVERWHRRGRIDERQMAGIMVYQGAYRIWIGQPRLTANWGAVIIRQAADALELFANSRIRARQTLRLFDQEIFFRRGVDDFNVWQNVVIFDEPAGVAGSRLGYTHKQAEAAAQVVISSIAHEIASLVIDGPPPELESLILEIDRPRKSRT